MFGHVMRRWFEANVQPWKHLNIFCHNLLRGWNMANMTFDVVLGIDKKSNLSDWFFPSDPPCGKTHCSFWGKTNRSKTPKWPCHMEIPRVMAIANGLVLFVPSVWKFCFRWLSCCMLLPKRFIPNWYISMIFHAVLDSRIAFAASLFAQDGIDAVKLDADALVGNVGLKLGNSQVYPVYPLVN